VLPSTAAASLKLWMQLQAWADKLNGLVEVGASSASEQLGGLAIELQQLFEDDDRCQIILEAINAARVKSPVSSSER
jgi:hypothetical protein